MADLDVVKKKKSPIGWIILALLILALIAFLLLYNNNDGAVNTTPGAAFDSATAPSNTR